MNIKETYSIDRCLNISLFEYNLIAVKNEFCSENELMFIAVNPYDPQLFSVAYINTKEIINLLNAKGWINEADLKAFYEFSGYEKIDFSDVKRNEMIFLYIVYDLINYFGLLNFIDDYSPIDLETLNTWFSGLHMFEIK